MKNWPPGGSRPAARHSDRAEGPFPDARGPHHRRVRRFTSTSCPEIDAAVVEKLAAAGAVMMGKLNMHELAYGITSANPHFGPVRNPWNTAHIPGGSSGGSGAAVSAGFVFAAMGSDTGGSIRIPASFCGTVGIKPTYGRVSRYGALPLGYSLDHMGPLTRSVRDAALVLNAIAGYDRTGSRVLTARRCRTSFPARAARSAACGSVSRRTSFFDRIDPGGGVGACGARSAGGGVGRGGEARHASPTSPD